MRAAAALFALLVLAAPAAQAKARGLPAGSFATYPDDFGNALTAPDALRNFLASRPDVSTVVFQKGTHDLGASPVFVFRRSGLTLCGATGRAEDVVLTTSSSVSLVLEQTGGIVLRDLTVRSTATRGNAVRLNSVFSTDVESFADDTRLEGCAFEAFIGIQAAVRARNLTVTGSRCTVTQPGGAGLLWEDGTGLFVTRTRFNTTSNTATAAIFVDGAQSPTSQGDRARHILLSRNTVTGDFATGFDLADVTDADLRDNRITFPGPQFATQTGLSGRVGIVIRRAAASALTENYFLTRNSVRKAHYGLWLLNAGRGGVLANRFGACGSPVADGRFGDTGGAMRLNLQSAVCNISIQRNDFRGLASPSSAPAVGVLPAGNEGVCFGADDRNLVDRGRPLYLGAPTT